jgi:hypothetical protein
MTAGSGAQESGEKPPCAKGSIEDPVDGGETVVDPAPQRPRQRRRKAGAVYRPV